MRKILFFVLIASVSYGQQKVSGSGIAVPWVVATGGTGAATLTSHSVLLGAGTSAVNPLAVPASGTLLQGAASADPSWTATPSLGVSATTAGTLTLYGGTSGSVILQTAAAAGTGTVFQFPANNGTNTYVLQTNGSGVTSWVAGGGGTIKTYSCTIANATANSQTAVITVSIPANDFADGDLIFIRYLSQVSNNSGGAVNLTPQFTWNGNSNTLTANSVSSSATVSFINRGLSVWREADSVCWTFQAPSAGYSGANQFDGTLFAGNILTGQTFTSTVDLKLSFAWASTGASIYYKVISASCVKYSR